MGLPNWAAVVSQDKHPIQSELFFAPRVGQAESTGLLAIRANRERIIVNFQIDEGENGKSKEQVKADITNQ